MWTGKPFRPFAEMRTSAIAEKDGGSYGAFPAPPVARALMMLSGADDGVGPTTAAIIVDDAWKLVDEIGRATGLDGPTIFMGWSLGATKALGVASAHPERATGLVILGQ